ncbi:8513_t:CDS:10 [Paraglomus brasilianum]|uniref:8513_t:CDS:1 n=1 Tax=Paraglomus brasilianum TaxID=144538 RepID=A0A9N8ZVG7_9GLOM|nr:8513_t:CDS:10 [Paraglomus brasilianum]
MAQSDMTEYGGENVVLTETQKACVTLARGFYSSARVLLLDDCLSSVDAPKARLILENCRDQGFFNGRTVIAVSQYARLLLSSAEYMVVLGDGTVLTKGTPDEVKNSGALSEEMLGVEEDLNNEMIDRPVTETRNWASDEVRTHGFVRPRVYWFYMKSSGGVIIWLALVLLFGIIRSLTVGETYLLKVWSDAFDAPNTSVNMTHGQLAGETETKPYVDNLYYLRIYAVIALVSASVTIARMICQSCISLKGSKRLFTRPLNAILRAPLSFFDTAPLGRIMNRFSKDLGLVDQGIVTVMANFLGNLVGAISVLLVVTAVVKEYSLVSVIIAICYIRIGTMYINASRELKQLQSKTRTVVTSWFSDTASGITVIRAYNHERHFASVFVERLNTANRTTYLLHMSNRWMSVRMGCIGAVASYLAGVFILWHFDRINAGLAGFALSYALGFVQIVFLLVKDFITMETGLNSVERIEEYIDMPQEPPAIIDSQHPPNAWPTRGNIEVTKLVVKYSEANSKPALNNITFSVDSEEKIGIVGRTGSGKTTLANSFLRLIEPSDGAIVIDGINIADIGLEDLRSRITLINEDPILFEGTIRSNLDICNMYNDHELWESLRRVNFISIEENPASDQGGILVGPIKSLDDPVNEGGSNFSRGHRQLLCLARALLRQAKIIVMDEAMASIDPEMANKIQEIIRNEFHHATVLCISHRFRTVIDSDRMLVLDDGEIAEYDTPYNLIMDPKSLFHYLCEQTGELDSLTELVKLNHPEFDILEEDQEDEAEEAEDEEEEEVEAENAGSSEEEQYNENSQEEELEYEDDVEEHDSLEQESQGDHLSSNERTLSDEATEDQE